MAAHIDITDNEYHTTSLTVTGSARGIDGPSGTRRMFLYVTTAAAAVYVQTGNQVDGTTDLSTNGAPVPTETWVEVECEPKEASGPTASRPSVFVQTDTNPTSITYRFTRGDA